MWKGLSDLTNKVSETVAANMQEMLDDVNSYEDRIRAEREGGAFGPDSDGAPGDLVGENRSIELESPLQQAKQDDDLEHQEAAKSEPSEDDWKKVSETGAMSDAFSEDSQQGLMDQSKNADEREMVVQREDLVRQVTSLQSQLAQEEVNRLQLLSSKTDELEQLRHQEQEWREKAATAENTCATTEKRLVTLQEEVERLQALQDKDKEEQDAKLGSQIEAEMTRLREENERLRAELDEAVLTRGSQVEAASESVKVTELEQRLATMSASFDKMQATARATFESEQSLHAKVQEYEAQLDALEAQQKELKSSFRQADEERDTLQRTVTNLREELNRKVHAHKQGVNTLTGQLGEIERLRSEVASRQDREQQLLRDMEMYAGVEQQVHKLSAQLQVTQSELRVAEVDVERLKTERENLTMALNQLNAESDARAKVHKRKMDEGRRELAEKEAEHARVVARLHEEVDLLRTKNTEVKEELVQSQKAHDLLQFELDGLKQQQEHQEINFRERQKSSELDPAELERVVEETSSHAGTETEEDARVDREMLKKLVVTYFIQKQSGTFQAQNELLLLMANMLEMNDQDRQALGIIVPRRRSQSAQSLHDGEGEGDSADPRLRTL
ncbi:Laminin subunit alpha-3 [Durusdinium trenchii]|uniref:Laminin subunit alpha-3 n=1 Tax=Durusdinium trenchii TaxID=1381693 RepID=A0ABP0HEL2_9DINO